MLQFLRQLHHFPSRPEDCLVTLFLPELYIEFPAWKLALYKPGLPFRVGIAVHLVVPPRL